MNTSSEKVLPLAKLIAENLAFRQSAKELFDRINQMEESTIVFDFSEVTFMTSSFAHQYVVDKKKSRKKILEKNVPANIKPMFVLARKRESTPKRTVTKTPKVLELAF